MAGWAERNNHRRHPAKVQFGCSIVRGFDSSAGEDPAGSWQGGASEYEKRSAIRWFEGSAVRGDPAPPFIVLDDVLTATDAGRLARVMGVLEEAAQRLQVLVLTCHPERYRGLEGASFVDLEAIVQGAGS
jgi:hypothetical protein